MPGHTNTSHLSPHTSSYLTPHLMCTSHRAIISHLTSDTSNLKPLSSYHITPHSSKASPATLKTALSALSSRNIARVRAPELMVVTQRDLASWLLKRRRGRAGLASCTFLSLDTLHTDCGQDVTVLITLNTPRPTGIEQAETLSSKRYISLY